MTTQITVSAPEGYEIIQTGEVQEGDLFGQVSITRGGVVTVSYVPATGSLGTNVKYIQSNCVIARPCPTTLK